MAKRKSKKTIPGKLERARRIVVLCMRLARKKLRMEFVDLIAVHIVATLPASSMRRLVNGDYGKPMKEAMMLTLPFFAGKRSRGALS